MTSLDRSMTPNDILKVTFELTDREKKILFFNLAKKIGKVEGDTFSSNLISYLDADPVDINNFYILEDLLNNPADFEKPDQDILETKFYISDSSVLMDPTGRRVFDYDGLITACELPEQKVFYINYGEYKGNYLMVSQDYSGWNFDIYGSKELMLKDHLTTCRVNK